MQTGSFATWRDSRVFRSMASRPSMLLTNSLSDVMQVPKQVVVSPGYLE